MYVKRNICTYVRSNVHVRSLRNSEQKRAKMVANDENDEDRDEEDYIMMIMRTMMIR